MIAYMSNVHIDPDIAFELFLEPLSSAVPPVEPAPG